MPDPAGDRPWEALPRELAATLRPELPGLADEIVSAVRREIPAYGRGPLPPRLRVGVEEALRQFVEMIERPGPDRGQGREVYVGLGRGEMRAGRGLDALLAAYRLGARIAWRRLAAAGAGAGLAPDTMYLLAESIFAYIDELSAESAEGHSEEQSAAAGEAQHRRRRLVALLVQEPGPDPIALEAAAEEADWPLAASVAVVATAHPEPERIAGRIGADAVAAGVDGVGCIVVPDPDAPGRRAAVERAVARRAGGGEPLLAALGPKVSTQEAAISFRQAGEALALAREGALAGDGLVVAGDYALELMLARERRLVRALGEALLAPLAALTPAARERLSTTLLAWLRHQGRLAAVARELHVHPQTVRYRLGRLRELTGDLVDDPERRLALELALRGERLDARRGAGDSGRPASAPTTR
jgi:hypothetical protein